MCSLSQKRMAIFTRETLTNDGITMVCKYYLNKEVNALALNIILPSDVFLGLSSSSPRIKESSSIVAVFPADDCIGAKSSSNPDSILVLYVVLFGR